MKTILNLLAIMVMLLQLSPTQAALVIDCHEGENEQCQGCTWYTLVQAPDKLEFSSQTGEDPSGPSGQPQYFKSVRFQKYTHDGKTGYWFTGKSTQAMRSAYGISGLYKFADLLGRTVFDVQESEPGVAKGSFEYQILGITVAREAARCEVTD